MILDYILQFYDIIFFISSLTFVIPLIPKLSTRTFTTFGGRKRHEDEVYIPVPIIIHKTFPKFFPDRENPFTLIFPDGEKVSSKICQENGKSLMTKSNRKLGKLILRDGLKLKIGELATYEKLQMLGIDSVRIDKVNDLVYEINFSKNGSYEEFISNSI